MRSPPLDPDLPDARGLLWVRRGRAPNCSATGAIVGAALVSAVAAAAVVNAFADRFARWRRAPGEGQARLRPERFGALLALPGAAVLLALDPEAAAEAESAGAVVVGTPEAPEGALSAPIEVHLAATDRCPAGCTTCYLDARPGPSDAASVSDADLDALAAAGVFEIAIGGGEGAPRSELIALGRRISARGMIPNLTTSGFHLDRQAAEAMAATFGQINVSLDGLGATYRAVRGWDGAALALAAIEHLVAAGARVGANTVLTRDNLPELEAIGEALAQRGAVEWQWLRLKPAGRGRHDYARKAPSPEDRHALWPRALAIEAATGLALRWDCAMVPFLAEHGLPVEVLHRLGIRGCPGGTELLARAADGGWVPCSFAHADVAHGSFGEVWREGAALRAWRADAADPPEPCASCAYHPICRGGCRIVAGHHGDPAGPDPECARVRAARA